jgi:hypothetical protein
MKLQNLTVFFVLLLLIVSSSTSLMPAAKAVEITTIQQGLTVLADVVNLDTARYTINTKQYQIDTYLGGVLPEERARYELYTNGSKIEALYTFVNGKILMVDMVENQGSPRLTKTVSGTAEMAKDFLANYQAYSKNPFYGELRSSLSGIGTQQNMSKIIGNTKLEVNNTENRVTFRWTYVFNGIEAPDKVVALGYEKGFLEYFYDSWDLYQIGSTEVNVTEKQAVELGLAKAATFAWPSGANSSALKVQNFNVTGAMVWETVFRSSLVADKPRNVDALVLYPMRHVWVSLDKFYPPGNVYGFNVYIWADTGEVCHIQERCSTIDPPSELVASTDDVLTTQTSMANTRSSSVASLWLVLPVGLAICFGASQVWLNRKKNLPIRRFFKFGGLLLCFLTLSMLFVSIGTVSAASQRGRSMVWGSESAGAYYDPPGWSWRKHPTEVWYQNQTAAYINSKFSSNGYEASDYQGNLGYNSGSWKVAVLEKTSEAEANYPRVAVVDFDHGNGNAGLPWAPQHEFHYMFEDQYGTLDGVNNTQQTPILHEHAIYDMDIYPLTDQGKVFFAFINTCNSAHVDDSFYGQYYSKQGLIPGTDRARGIPFAWSHQRPNVDMSGDGYANPDTGDFVFLGFLGGSAALQQPVEGSWVIHDEWVRKFFNDALTNDLTVNAALDSASRYYFSGNNFDQTPLSYGFTAVWPIYKCNEAAQPPYWYWDFGSSVQGLGRMKVYGNGNIRLYQEGLIWKLDEGQGTTAYDTFVHNNHGTVYGGASWTTGKVNSALSFDGSNDYIYKSYSSSLNGLSAVTLMQWVKLDAVPQSYSVNLGGVLGEYWLEYRNNQYLSLSTYINSQYNGDGFYANLADGKWHLLTMTYNGVYKKGYLDGTLMATYSIPGTLASTGYPFKVGESFPASQGYNGCPDGIIDEVRVYNYAFSAKQIADEASILSCHLNGGNYAYDSSPFGNDGTIYGASWIPGVRTSGFHGYALNFDGDDFVSVPSSNRINALGQVGTSYSIALWFKTNVKVDQSLTEKWIGTPYPFVLRGPIDTGQVYFALYDGTNNPTACSSADLADNAWHYVVATVTRGEKLRLYVDGALVSEADDTTVGDISNSGAFPIGARSFSPSYPFHGAIDEFRLYDRALSSNEIEAHYNANLPYHWISVAIEDDSYSLPLQPWIKVDGQFTGYGDVQRGTQHTVEVEEWLYNEWGWFVFDRFTYGSSTSYSNPMTLPAIYKDIVIIAHYTWYGY